MEPYCTGTARIKHKASGVIHEIACDELDWQSSSDERQMGPETCYEAMVEHPQLGALSWSLWEYPTGVENDRRSDAGGHDIVEDFEYGLNYVKEPYDWTDYDPPNDPHSIFLDSYRQTKAMLTQRDEDSGLDLLNRMLFTQHITALEAYLGDTLIKSVFSDPEAMTRLMAEDEDLAKRKFSLADIAQTPDLVQKTIRKHLRSILYHNLEKVEFLYRSALQVCIFQPSTDKASLFRAVQYRHHCVHRNGFDAEGNELALFTKDFVQKTGELTKEFVAKIEEQLQPSR
jgi:hypothetical protein